MAFEKRNTPYSRYNAALLDDKLSSFHSVELRLDQTYELNANI
ncbi:hypothetical protein CISG_06617 [Coccidioides immitis RMSCC 3703]|uniref:Uncharacterized protein n=1 Tax=Coccidioides immitis RMSCC 3703 TaxID=454286 RepID=A0A0J8QZ86_COCIT|nr:hypothetical protein CISG_06617 [Coccidioides immitis RMSCC 3703]